MWRDQTRVRHSSGHSSVRFWVTVTRSWKAEEDKGENLRTDTDETVDVEVDDVSHEEGFDSEFLLISLGMLLHI